MNKANVSETLEWVELIKQAKSQGLTKEEVREFLNSQKNSK